MSTKNLARTVIEGGRHRYNKWDRRYSHAETRAHEKAYISEVKEDLENWYDYDIEPTRPVYKGFSDKLGPMNRWLASQCGKPWSEVRSLISTEFDTRTTAGRHIVHDHMLNQVSLSLDEPQRRYFYGPEDPTQSYYSYHFYVDDSGILRQKTRVPRPNKHKTPAFNTNSIANWLSGRVVGKVDKKLFWFVPADKNKKRGGIRKQWITRWGYLERKYWYSYSYGLHYYYLRVEPIYKKDKDGNLVLEKGKPIAIDYQQSWQNGTPTFRQDRKLNDKELKFWNSIPECYQTKVLEYSPTWDGPPRKTSYY